MTVLITGNGHSGTTFTARLLMECGCDFGQGSPAAAWTEGNHAMEVPVIQAAAFLVARGDTSILPSALAQMPPFVKAPAIGWFLDTWLESGFKADLVVFCHRPIEDSIASILRMGGGYGGGALDDNQWARDRLYGQTGRLMATLWDRHIPFVTILFPAILDSDPSTVYGVFKPVLQCSEAAFGAAFQRIAHPDWVHIR